jgi:hypothetical protein
MFRCDSRPPLLKGSSPRKERSCNSLAKIIDNDFQLVRIAGVGGREALPIPNFRAEDQYFDLSVLNQKDTDSAASSNFPIAVGSGPGLT